MYNVFKCSCRCKYKTQAYVYSRQQSLELIITTTRRVRPPNGGLLHEPPSPVSTARPMWLTSGRISHEAVYAGRCGAGPQAGAGPRAAAGPCTLGYTNVVAVTLAKTAATVRKCAFSPNCWGTGGVEGWGGNGRLLEAYSTKPTCKPQRTMCSF